MSKALMVLLVLIVFIMKVIDAGAHESQPGSLEIRQVAEDRYEVTWRAPTYYGRPHPARLELPEDWRDEDTPSSWNLPDSQVFRRLVRVGEKGVDGSTVRFPGLEQTITDVFIRLIRQDGTAITTVAQPARPWAQLRDKRNLLTAAGEYGVLGLHHILTGGDHLLFVLGLLLIVRGRLLLVKTITSFTVAHSITLAIATLGIAGVPLPPLNAAIALSILFLGPEIVRSQRGEMSLTILYPWLIAFFFGLLHGFGFAGGLSTAGMPKSEIPQALLFFNLGVEAGQLAFVFMALALARSFSILEIRWPGWVKQLPAYAVGGLGAYWTIQRTAILIGGLSI